VNTSFNVKDEPIVCTPEDAYRCFMKTEIDALVLESFLIAKPTVVLADLAGQAASRRV
jgi:carbamoyltransferase